MGNGDDLNPVRLNAIDDQERESAHQVAACSRDVGRIHPRCLRNPFDGEIQLIDEGRGRLGATLVVPGPRSACLVDRFRRELDR